MLSIWVVFLFEIHSMHWNEIFTLAKCLLLSDLSDIFTSIFFFKAKQKFFFVREK